MKGEQSRQRVVSTALRLFHERGYANTSLADVAEQSGLLKGNLAYYFKTKPDLLRAVTEARQRALRLALSGEGSDDSLSLGTPDATACACRGVGAGACRDGLPTWQSEHGTR
jgi:AcrR family transcriptional regulator